MKSCQSLTQILKQLKTDFSLQKLKVGGYQNLLPIFLKLENYDDEIFRFSIFDFWVQKVSIGGYQKVLHYKSTN